MLVSFSVFVGIYLLPSHAVINVGVGLFVIYAPKASKGLYATVIVLTVAVAITCEILVRKSVRPKFSAILIAALGLQLKNVCNWYLGM
jgi:hypothetical protein